MENPNGTAPAFIVEDSRGVVICLPGVPFEMKWLFEHSVVPYLRERFRLEEVITSRVLKVAGLGESAVDHRIGHLMASMSNPTIGVLAHPGQVDVRITAKSASTRAALGAVRGCVRGSRLRHSSSRPLPWPAPPSSQVSFSRQVTPCHLQEASFEQS